MNFRSTNPEGYVHFGGDVMSGANSSRGVLLSSNSISPVSDNAAEDLHLRPKGTGKVNIGSSTSGLKYLATGTALSPLVALPISALVYSTITIPGAVVGDALFLGRSTGMSTALGMAGAYVSAADEGTYAVINNQASTQSIAALSPFTYLLVR